MDLHPKQILELLEKPLSLASNFIFALSDGKPLKSSGGPNDGNYKPSPSNHSPITSNPLVPACIVLLVGFLVLSFSPIRVWLTEADDLPTLVQIFSFSRKKPAPSLPGNAENVSVWTKKQSGFYYCQGGTLFGDEPGEIMTQAVALTSGYRPVDDAFCVNNQPNAAPVQVAEDQPEVPVRSADAKVWGLKQLGFYYCPGDALFGQKPGLLMTQSEAMAHGLVPSYHTCPGSNANLVASTGSLPAGTQESSVPVNASSLPMGPSTPTSESAANASQSGDRVNVWVKKEFGFYYCRNDVLFGNKPGQLMSQADALSAGYQPSDGQCSDGKGTQATAERLMPRTLSGKN